MDGGYGHIKRNSSDGVLFNWYFNAAGYQGSSYIGTVSDANWVIKNR